MGQHFLADPHVAAMIVKGAEVGFQDTVLEIGAGLGALTFPLAGKARHVLAVEPDQRIAALLRSALLIRGVSNVTIIEEDILQCDIETFAEAQSSSFKVVGNLPYHISSQVLVQLINARHCIRGAVLMFQKELAERLLSPPGSKTYGRLSVMIQYCARLYPLAHVGASAFFPKPKVDSEVIGIAFYPSVPFYTPDQPFLFQVVQAAFGKRRKTLKNALMNSHLGLKEGQVILALKLASIDPKRRAETLRVAEFVKLAGLLKKGVRKHGRSLTFSSQGNKDRRH